MIYLWIIPTLICIYVFFRQRFLLSPTALFVMYFALIFPIAYLVSYALDSPSFYVISPRSMHPDKVLFAFVQVMLSLAAFLAGRSLIPAFGIHWTAVTFRRNRFPLLIGASGLAAAVGAIVVLREVGGLSALVDNSGEIRSGGLRGLGAGTYAVTNLLPTVAQFVLMYAYRQRSRWTGWIFALCVLSCLLAGVFGFRGGIFGLVLQVTAISYLMSGKPTRKQSLIAIPILGLVISGLGLARLLTTDAEVTQAALNAGTGNIVNVLADTVITRTRGVETQVIMNDYMQHSEYHWFGENIIETAHSFIPSFILSKDISLSEKIGTQVYSGYLVASEIVHEIYGGVSYSLIAEATWNMGLLGVIVCSGVIGYSFRIVEVGKVGHDVSYVRVIVYKALAAAVIPVLESPQLAVNGVILNLILNGGLLLFLSVVLQQRAPAPVLRTS